MCCLDFNLICCKIVYKYCLFLDCNMFIHIDFYLYSIVYALQKNRSASISAGQPGSPTHESPTFDYLHILEKLVAESDTKSVVFTEEVSKNVHGLKWCWMILAGVQVLA